MLRHEFGKQKCGEQGRHVIWGFSPEQKVADCAPSTEAFWESAAIHEAPGGKTGIWLAIRSLEDMGLLIEIPHLVENSSLTCEPIHGLSWDGKGEPEEQQLANAALSAGLHLVTKDPLRGTFPQGCVTIVPVWDTLPDVQLIGVFRLRYRPQTSLTADWYRRHMENAAAYLKIYREIGPSVAKIRSLAKEDW